MCTQEQEQYLWVEMECPQEGQVFSRKEYPSQTFINECNICAETFCQLSDMKIHMNRHSEIYPSQCRACFLRFIDDGELGSHIKSRHIRSTNYETDSNDKLAGSLLSHSSVQDYRCVKCNINSFPSWICFEEHHKSHLTLPTIRVKKLKKSTPMPRVNNNKRISNLKVRELLMDESATKKFEFVTVEENRTQGTKEEEQFVSWQKFQRVEDSDHLDLMEERDSKDSIKEEGGFIGIDTPLYTENQKTLVQQLSPVESSTNIIGQKDKHVKSEGHKIIFATDRYKQSSYFLNKKMSTCFHERNKTTLFKMNQLNSHHIQKNVTAVVSLGNERAVSSNGAPKPNINNREITLPDPVYSNQLNSDVADGKQHARLVPLCICQPRDNVTSWRDSPMNHCHSEHIVGSSTMCGLKQQPLQPHYQCCRNVKQFPAWYHESQGSPPLQIVPSTEVGQLAHQIQMCRNKHESPSNSHHLFQSPMICHMPMVHLCDEKSGSSQCESKYLGRLMETNGDRPSCNTAVSQSLMENHVHHRPLKPCYIAPQRHGSSQIAAQVTFNEPNPVKHRRIEPISKQDDSDCYIIAEYKTKRRCKECFHFSKYII